MKEEIAMLSQSNGAAQSQAGAQPTEPAGATAAAAQPVPALRTFRPDSPYVALGLAVNHLMTKPAFANLKFGDWARILVGQINRKHFFFVLDARNQVQGFAGWALTTQERADAWVENRGGLSFEDSLSGNCVIFNAWAASSLTVNRFILRESRKVIQGKDWVYFKRFYKDGRTKPMRLTVNEFVDRHVERAKADA
jgi:hemolysin-activating ACP:hemolysin acyltransferase